MLDDLMTAAQGLNQTQFHIFIDPRYDQRAYLAPNITYHETARSKRILVDGRIKGLVDDESIVLNIGSMPSFIRLPCSVIQFLLNRYLIDDYSKKGMPYIMKLRLTLQIWGFRICLKNVDQYFVPNMVMKDILLNQGYPDEKIRVIPYKNIDVVKVETDTNDVKGFLYVASDEPHKNHINLVKAWKLLGEEGIRPPLYLTIDDGTELTRFITSFVKQYGLDIQIKSTLPREELMSYYRRVKALIFPSFFESFGIPLIEANNFDLPIIAAELDYVRDFIKPAETFDPSSPRSIARAVKRFLGAQDDRFKIITAKDFVRELEQYV